MRQNNEFKKVWLYWFTVLLCGAKKKVYLCSACDNQLGCDKLVSHQSTLFRSCIIDFITNMILIYLFMPSRPDNNNGTNKSNVGCTSSANILWFSFISLWIKFTDVHSLRWCLIAPRYFSFISWFPHSKQKRVRQSEQKNWNEHIITNCILTVIKYY